MNTRKSLVLGRAIFFLIVFVAFGVIIVTEKAGDIFTPRIKEKLNTYLKENYSDIKQKLNEDEINYKSTKYNMKVTSKDNKKLYFYITYQRGEITDTYKEDYLEGKTLLSKLEKEIEEEIQNKTSINYKVQINNKLNEYNSKVQERIINEENLLTLKFYNLSTELEVNSWDYETITNEIINNINKTYSKEITPKYYEFTIINSQDITTSITIFNLNEAFISNENNYQIIYSIMQKQDNEILKNSEITYKYNK